MKVLNEAIKRIEKEKTSNKDSLSGHSRWGKAY